MTDGAGRRRFARLSNGGALGRRFALLLSAYSSSNFGDGLTLVAFPLLATDLTTDARLIALVAAFRMLPFLTIGLPAGVLIDRFDRRKLAMLAQVVRASALVAIAATVLTDTASITTLAIGAFVVGVGEVLTDGGLPAVVRDVVATDQLERANSRLRANETVANNFVGPPVGAALFGVNASTPFIAAAALYLATIALLSLLPGDFRAEPGDDLPFLKKMSEGVRYVWAQNILRPLALAVALFSFFGAAMGGVFVILATEHLGLSDFEFSLLLTLDAVAAVCTTFVLTRLIKRTSHGTSMRISVVAFATYGVLLGSTTWLPLVVLAMLLSGVADPTWNVVSATVRQRIVDDKIFGRAMTGYLFIAWSIQPIGSVFGGVIADRYGSERIYLVGGLAVGSLLLLGRTMFARIDAAMAAPTSSN